MRKGKRTPTWIFILMMLVGVVMLIYESVSIWESTGKPPKFTDVWNSLKTQAQSSAKDMHMPEMDARVKIALSDLFDEMDTNGDGSIDRSEFEGMTLSSVALLYSFSSSLTQTANRISPLLKRLKDRVRKIDMDFESFTSAGPVSWFKKYLEIQMTFHALLFVVENLRHYVGIRRSGWHFPDDKERVPPNKVEKASKAEALRYTTPLVGTEMLKLWFMTITGVAFFRLFCFFFSVFLGLVFLNVAAMSPNRKWRDFWMYGPVRLCTQMMLTFLGYYRVDVHGTLASVSETKLLVPNHVGAVEIFVLFGLAFPSFVSAIENTRLPFFGAICRVTDAILVDRSDPDSKRKTKSEILQRVRDKDTKSQLMVFPEGTTVSQAALFQFKRGVFEAGEPMQLVAFKMPYHSFNPSYTGQAVGGNETFDLLWRSACQFVQRMEVKFLPVHKPTEAERKDATLYANNMQRLMASHLGCKISDATYKDYVSVEKAYKALQKAAITRARAKRMQRLRSGSMASIDKFWNPISTCLVCVPGLHHPRSVKIDLDKFNFEKGVVVDNGEKKKDE